MNLFRHDMTEGESGELGGVDAQVQHRPASQLLLVQPARFTQARICPRLDWEKNARRKQSYPTSE
jgi:hypothetical protein